MVVNFITFHMIYCDKIGIQCITTWYDFRMAIFEHMTKFHFSISATDEYSFYLSTLEAALTYLKSGENKVSYSDCVSL